MSTFVETYDFEGITIIHSAHQVVVTSEAVGNISQIWREAETGFLVRDSAVGYRSLVYSLGLMDCNNKYNWRAGLCRVNGGTSYRIVDSCMTALLLFKIVIVDTLRNI